MLEAHPEPPHRPQPRSRSKQVAIDLSAVANDDRLGRGEFLGRVGTTALVERARELGVQTTVLATTDVQGNLHSTTPDGILARLPVS